MSQTPTSKEPIPTVIKSHIPEYLKPKPKQNAKGNNQTKENGATPAIVKRKQVTTKGFCVNSPTDAFLSPCTQKLMKPKHDLMVPPINLDMKDEDSDKSLNSSK